jgi:hypothetical protein
VKIRKNLRYLERAGGYNRQAYPYGAVLMRREVRQAQEAAHAELVHRVQALQANVHLLPEGSEVTILCAPLTFP